MKFIIILAVIIICITILPLFSNSEETEKEIEFTLDNQVQAWNDKNLDGYMSYYWNSEKLTFQGEDKLLLGWKTLFEMYETKYSGEKMGTLTFTNLQINIIAPDHAYVLGEWSVKQKEKEKKGVFTIILKRFAEGWRIIHDHSS